MVNLPDCHCMTLFKLEKHQWERRLGFWRTIGEMRMFSICYFVCWSLSRNLTPLSPPRTPRFSILGGVKTMNFCQKMVTLGDFTLWFAKLWWSRNLTPLFPPRTPRFSILGWVKTMNFQKKWSLYEISLSDLPNSVVWAQKLSSYTKG